nr:ABC transporter ATP-binding protein [Amylibacter cionae]
MTEMMLDIRNLKVSIPTDRGMLNAVRGVDLQIAKGETLCLVGESGCGKSLTATSIMGLLPRYARVTSDRFEMAGQDLSTKTDAKLAKLRGRDVAMIFQDPTSALNPTLTIGRQLTEGVMRHEKLSRSEADARAIEMLDRVGIANPAARLTQYPHGFSGGQRQRIMIASALMGRPGLLIADEPTTALDVTIQAQILTLLGELQADLGLSLLLITHDLGVVAAIADNVAVMYAGRIAERASAVELFAAPRHPYTKGLLAAIPVPGVTRRGSELPAIPGRVPGLIGTMQGCAFRDRCSIAGPECANDPVPLVSTGQGHFIECVKAAEVSV